MANTRWFRSSQNVALLGTVKNGSGGGAPATSEDSSFPMTNVTQHDRYTPWKTPSTPPSSPLVLDVDLNGTYSIYSIGLHRYELLGGSAGTLTIQTQTGAYTPGGSWTTFDTISSANLTSSKDRAVVNTSTVSARSLRFSFAHTSGIWSVGKLWAVVAPTVEVMYSPNSVLTPVRHLVENVDANGVPIINDYNEDGFLWSLGFENTTLANRTALWTLVNSGRPCSMLDDNDKLEEVRVVGGVIPTTRVFIEPWSPRLELARLP